MIKKLLSVFLVLVLTLGLGIIPESKAQGAPFSIMDVDIDGTNIDLNGSDILYIERGETINVRAEIQSNDVWPINTNSIKDVRVRIEIDGYEYDTIDDVTEMFDVEQGVKYVKHLKLTIPDDIDASENYNLRIRAYNQEYSTDNLCQLRIKAERHKISIMDVIFTPGLSLSANQPLFTTVRVENLGDKKEEDIKVSISVPELGKEGITYIDELAADYVEEDEEDIETSESSDAVYLDLRGAKSGTYDLIVKVEYNRGHEELTKNYQLVIDGVSTEKTEEILIDSAEKSKIVEAGQGIVYKIDIANLGSNARSFTAEISGLDWGSYRVDPTPVVVQAGSSAEMFVYVSPNVDIMGQKTFTVNVKEGSNVVKQISFETSITEVESEWSNVLTGLEIGFIVLLIILVILGIILAATKMGNKKEEAEEPLGESYY